MITKAEIKLTYNWNDDRLTLGQIVIGEAGNNKEAAKKILNERLEHSGIYEEALILQVADDIGIPGAKKVIKVNTSDDIGALFAAIFGN